MTLRLTFWPAPLQALALVMNPRLGLQQVQNLMYFILNFFDFTTFAHNPNEKIRKLESKSIPCVFLGYCEGTKAYHFMCVKTKRIIKS